QLSYRTRFILSKWDFRSHFFYSPYIYIPIIPQCKCIAFSAEFFIDVVNKLHDSVRKQPASIDDILQIKKITCPFQFGTQITKKNFLQKINTNVRDFALVHD